MMIKAVIVAAALVLPSAAFASWLEEQSPGGCQADVNAAAREIVLGLSGQEHGGGLGQLKKGEGFPGGLVAEIPTNVVAEFRNDVRSAICGPN